jgi:DNA-binding transcriptional ArsR family regulator
MLTANTGSGSCAAQMAGWRIGLTITKGLYNLVAMLDLNTTFAALSDPTRRAILGRLALGEQTVMELAQPFDMSQPAISKHLRVLENAGLIARRIAGAKRPCRLVKGGVDAIDQWLAMLRKTLASNYERLDTVLADMQPPRGRRKR